MSAELRILLEDVHLSFGRRVVCQGLTCGFPRGKISVLMGGSGSGKSTLLRLIAGLVRPDRGRILVAEDAVTELSERELYRVRERIGMLFQHGALLDSMTIFDNVALPLREHTDLSERDIAAEVSRRLAAVGLPETENLLPRQLSGGMLRRAALARAIVSDPEIVLCDEPFSGLDPINVRRIERLLVELNQRLGITLLITSHHIPSSLRMADQIVFLLDGKAVSGSPKALLAADDERVREFLMAEQDAEGEGTGSVRVKLTAVENLGLRTVSLVAHLGRISVFIGQIGLHTLRPPLRFRRLLGELFDVGVLSLAIICLSGATVGAVLGLQGYTTLSRFGAENSLGAVVGLSLVRELGPVLTALLVTGRAGSAMAAEIASMVTTEQLDGLRMMSIDPVDFVVAPKALAMLLVMPMLNALFICFALFGGYLVGVQLLGVDAGTYVTSVENAITWSDDVAGTLLKSVVFGALVGFIATYRGYTAEPTSAGVSAATTGTVVVGSVTVLLFDYVITALWGV